MQAAGVPRRPGRRARERPLRRLLADLLVSKQNLHRTAPQHSHLSRDASSKVAQLPITPPPPTTTVSSWAPPGGTGSVSITPAL